MAGYLGSLNLFHSLRENKTALQAHPSGPVDVSPRRNVYHMEKQLPHRFTTGILTRQEREREKKTQRGGKEEGSRVFGSAGALMMGGKKEKKWSIKA